MANACFPVVFANRAVAELRRLRSEGEVLEREEKLERLVDSAMDAIVELNRTLEITRANTAAEQMFGCGRDRLVGRRFDELLTEAGRDKLAHVIEELTGQPKIRPSSHTDCGFGSYFLVSPAGEAVAIPRVINVEGLLTDMNSLARKIRRRGHPTWLDKIRTLRIFKRHYRPETAPEGLSMKLFIRSLQGMLDKKVGRGRGEGHTYKTLLCAGMHFQDRYNFDAERAKRCVILYATPDGLYPFCTFNCGPEFRQHMGPTSSSRAESAG